MAFADFPSSDEDFPARCPVCMAEMFEWADVTEHVGRHVTEYLEEQAALALEVQRRGKPFQKVDPVGEEIPQGLLVTERVGYQHLVDPYWLARSNVPERDMQTLVEQQVVDRLVAYGADRGFDIHRESVWLMRDDRPDQLGAVLFFGVWCPDPERGCDFRGGPFDGEVRSMWRTDFGYPERWWKLAMAPDPRDLFAQATTPLPVPLELQTVVYRLAGIDSMRDRWVYVCE